MMMIRRPPPVSVVSRFLAGLAVAVAVAVAVCLSIPLPVPVPVSVSATEAPAYNIAVLQHGPDAMGDFLVTGREGTFNFSCANAALARAQDVDCNLPKLITWSGFQTILKRVADMGGLLRRDGSRQAINITWFNLGRIPNPPIPPFINPALQRAAVLADKITNGTYGHFPIIITASFSHSLINNLFQQKCDDTKNCITLVAFDPAWTNYICSATSGNGCIVGERRYQSTLSSLWDVQGIMDVPFQLMLQYSFKSYGLLTLSNTIIDTSITIESDNACKYNRITYVYRNAATVETPYLIPPTGLFSADMMNRIVDQIIAANPDCLMVGATDGYPGAADNTYLLLQTLKRKNYMPKALIMAGGAEFTVAATYGADWVQYLQSLQPWHPSLFGLDYHHTTSNSTGSVLTLFPATATQDSPAVFNDVWSQYYGDDDTTIYAQLLNPIINHIWAFQGATFFYPIVQLIQETNGATTPATLMGQARNMAEPSFYGQISYTSYGMLTSRPYVMLQNIKDIVFPLYNAIPLVYPMPNWDERVYTPSYYAHTSEVVVAVVNSIAILLCLILLIWVIYHRNHRVIKAAMPDFCMLIIVGGCLMLISNYFIGLYVNQSMCITSSWLLTCGFSLVFTALFTKLFTVFQIFHQVKVSRKLQVVKVNRTQLYAICALGVASDVLINSIWTWYGKIDIQVVVTDVHRPSMNVTQCYTSNVSFACIVTSIVFKACIVMAALYMAVVSRNLPSAFNESKVMAASVYNVMVIGVFVVPLVASNTGGVETSYLIRSFGIMLFVTSTFAIIFGYKYYLILRPVKADAVSGFGTGTGTGNDADTLTKPSGGSAFSSGTGFGDVSGFAVSGTQAIPSAIASSNPHSSYAMGMDYGSGGNQSLLTTGAESGSGSGSGSGGHVPPPPPSHHHPISTTTAVAMNHAMNYSHYGSGAMQAMELQPVLPPQSSYDQQRSSMTTVVPPVAANHI